MPRNRRIPGRFCVWHGFCYVLAVMKKENIFEHGRQGSRENPSLDDKGIASSIVGMPLGVIGGVLGAAQMAKTASGRTKWKSASERKKPPEWSRELREQLKSDRLGQIALEKFDLTNPPSPDGSEDAFSRLFAENMLKRMISEAQVFRNTGFGDLIMAFYDMKGQVENAGVKLKPLVGLASSSYLMYLLGFIAENPCEQGIEFEFGGMA